MKASIDRPTGMLLLEAENADEALALREWYGRNIDLDRGKLDARRIAFEFPSGRIVACKKTMGLWICGRVEGHEGACAWHEP